VTAVIVQLLKQLKKAAFNPVWYGERHDNAQSREKQRGAINESD
jgi:hypothetical protein